MPSLDLLATFLEIYRAGSLSAAAQRLGVTQPAVSGQLARLEEQIGEPLFIRSRKGVTPTPRAAALAARVSLHLDGLRDALGSTETEPALRGTVRIGGAAEIMTLRVLPVLAPLTGRGLHLRAAFGLARDLLTDLAADRLDLVVSAIRPPHQELFAVPLVDEEFLLVGPPSMARTVDDDRLRTAPADALAALPLVTYGEELPILRRYWRSEFGHRPANPVALVAPDLRAVLAAVEAGAGISALPRYVAEPALAAGRITELHRSEAPPLNTIYLAVRRGAPANPALTVVRERLIEAAAGWGGL
ncbi:LysR family transcriptional regulator [Streptomyces sp. NPDC046374]|uniref:LysR family transcriptional regulator n=1 Tax=Streptomyces sp. NPDC046374 TaxID=3154917 RepID=UPI0033E0AC94